VVSYSRATAGPSSLRPLNQPQLLSVEDGGDGVPKAVVWHGDHRGVTVIRDTWRIDDEWWRDEISRRYFLLELEGGHQLTVYHDMVADHWYAQPYEKPARPLAAGKPRVQKPAGESDSSEQTK